MVARLAEVLATSGRANNLAILLVEQNLAFALATADRYAVLKLGSIVATGQSSDADAAPKIDELMQV